MFNRKQAIAAINIDQYLTEFEAQLTTINTGWAIFWKGNMVKPLKGQNHYYASYESALQALDRNCGLPHSMQIFLAEKLFNFKIDTQWIHECKAYRDYFRMDLIWTDNIKNGKVISHNYISLDELSPEDQAIRTEKQKEHEAFSSFCNNALKTVFLKKWMKDGLLEIKKV